MSKSAYEITGQFTIYAIQVTDDLGDKVVFVGRTRSKDLNRVLRYHRDGKKKLTADDFSKESTATNPTIHVLTTLNNCNASWAYRYNLAWYRHIEESGYITLASELFDYTAYHMLQETYDIYQEISKIDVKQLLEIPYISPSKIKNERALDSKYYETDDKLMQLNLKVKQSDREVFSSLCQSNNMTQRELFAFMLANSSETAAVKIIKEQSNTIQKQLEEISKLKELPRGTKADVRLKQALSFTKAAISQYIELLMKDVKNDEPLLKCSTWNSFSNEFPNRMMYDYPIEDGYLIMKLEALCYGKGRYSAVFLWGEDLDTGCLKKLRYYPKREYCGISLPNNPCIYKGMILLVGYRVSPDNAADLYIALPLITSSAKLWTQAIECVNEKKPSLDEIMRRSQP